MSACGLAQCQITRLMRAAKTKIDLRYRRLSGPSALRCFSTLPRSFSSATSAVKRGIRCAANRPPPDPYKLAGCAGSPCSPGRCAAGILQLTRDFRARQRIGTAGVTLGWRRLSPSAELFVDPESGKRSAVRDPGALGAERYYWPVSAFGDHQVTAGRTGDVREARSQAEEALAGYMAAWHEVPGEERRNA
jgi:hypothetical protein